MMMMMGAMIALSGAYIAIAMQELNAANAAVLSQIAGWTNSFHSQN